MEQDPDQMGRDDDKASVGGASGLDFNFLDDVEEGTETLTGTTELAQKKASTLEPLLSFMNSPGKTRITIEKFYWSLRAGEE